MKRIGPKCGISPQTPGLSPPPPTQTAATPSHFPGLSGTGGVMCDGTPAYRQRARACKQGLGVSTSILPSNTCSTTKLRSPLPPTPRTFTAAGVCVGRAMKTK
ncbi:hypothetical protein BaRGS_00038975 [Batillaria attramentaria]|uniref:Uncharacterized protein n=1 Tax=Batillaria attramentaria TaxID=370345 RepID=A0ABD0J4N2_9CAEN